METECMQCVVENTKALTEEEKYKLQRQDSRKISTAKAEKLEKEAQRNWDIFYKRNDNKFFKDRHWITREFKELSCYNSGKRVQFLELGCGVGNTLYPLLEEGLNNVYYYACDFSMRAVDLVKNHTLYDENKVKAFQADITTNSLFKHIDEGSIDIISMIFVLSAIHPSKFNITLANAFKLLKPGGLLIFRDYGRYDMAQFRFKPGHKIDDNFYVRQDGTRAYYFSMEELHNLCSSTGFRILFNSYVQRRTINIKEKIDVPRIFLQGKYQKPN